MTAAAAPYRAALYELMDRWVSAERGNDATALEPLLTDDFGAVGPAGFRLDRDGWLSRYRSGDLFNDAFEWRRRRYGPMTAARWSSDCSARTPASGAAQTRGSSVARSWLCRSMRTGVLLRCT